MKTIFSLWLLVVITGCSVSKGYSPSHKFGAAALQEDYTVFRKVLEESHPSLYWYTPKDSMDDYFERGYRNIQDSMTEPQFRNILSYVLAKVRCGHTSVRASKAAAAAADRPRGVLFPLNIKAWPDTMVVTGNLNRKDSILTRGVVITAIDGKPVRNIMDSFFQHLSADGYNETHKYQSLSNSGVFRNMMGSIHFKGAKSRITYIDSSGNEKSTALSWYNPLTDTLARSLRVLPSQLSRRQRKTILRNNLRSLRIDTALNTAFLEVNSFTKKFALRRFFRTSFRKMKREGIDNLVVDMRGNGGGSVVLSNLLTKYIADQPFKIADSLYAIRNKSSFSKYQDKYFLNRLFFIFMTHRNRDDGRYHFRMYENRYFRPKKDNHFEGTTYILTGGNTFSAASLFAKALKEQPDVVIVGEETGGGAYGNSAWLIPDITLPKTGVRFRLPLFRLVIDKDEQKGRGVVPEVEALPSVKDIRRNADFKMEKAVELIKEKSKA